MSRFRNIDWVIKQAPGRPDSASDVHEATLAVLMDIREELQAMRRVLQCSNTTAIPHTLNQIEKNTRKKKRAKKPQLRVAS